MMTVIDFTKIKLVDLTHTLTPNIPSWNGSCGFRHEIKMDYQQGCRVQSIKMHAGVGTHMDAPAHFFPEALSVADIQLEKLFVPAVVIDVSKKSHEDYLISLEDIKEFEQIYGSIPNKSCVIGYTGWSKYWHDDHAYRNVKDDGVMHFPGFSIDAIHFLLERHIHGIAIDTLSPDGSNQTDFPVHKIVLGSNRYIIENIANAHFLPLMGAYVGCFPMKTHDLSEGPIRSVGFVSNN